MLKKPFLFGIAFLLASQSLAAVPTFAETRRDFQSSEARLLDRNFVVLHQLRVNPKERRLSWITLEDVSPALRNALIASEDQRFYQHSGVDWNAVAAAAWGNLWNRKTRGASTITMQLAGLLDQDLRRKAAPRSAAQKLSQAVLAQRLERQWRKDQILEAYLNLVGFRGELVGVHALSRGLFDKHPSGLDQTEAAIAVALIRAPNASAAKVAQRACGILKSQQGPKSLAQGAQTAQTCPGLEGRTVMALAKPASRGDNPASPGQGAAAQLAPHLAAHLAQALLKSPGQTLRTTLDANLQRFARDALTRQLAALTERNIEDGAVLVLDNASGAVLAWVGSSGPISSAADVDGVLAARQAGSTLKPFLYELAIENKWLTAASILNDAPINLPTASGLYIPQNYDKHYKGLVSLRNALGSSLNIPAVRTLVMVTPERLFQRMQALGFNLRETGDYYGYSLALGSADVSLLALTNAYRTLANQGRHSPVRWLHGERAVAAKAVMDPAAAFIVTDILADRNARALTFGLDNALGTRVWSAVKTGTSKDMRDNWCIGFSERYSVGVWVGNASGVPMWDVSGVTGAAPVWQEVIHYLHARDGRIPVAARGIPAGVRTQEISYQDRLEAPRTEYFMAGTEQGVIAAAQTDSIRPAIVYPTAGMVIALDPDIPPARQRVRFAAHGVARGGWLLDGKAMPKPGTGIGLDWMPWPGRHRLVLVNVEGRVLDRVEFEVRGAVVRAAVRKVRR